MAFVSGPDVGIKCESAFPDQRTRGQHFLLAQPLRAEADYFGEQLANYTVRGANG